MITINHKQTQANSFAYDGCHKIYLLEKEEDVWEAQDCGYDIVDIVSLKETFNNSCNLRFISSWSLDREYVRQFEPCTII
jgi:hypothetical protein